MNSFIMRERGNKKWNTYERSFVCYETDTESHEISITSFSISCCTEQDWDSLPFCRTLQLCKYSSCFIRPQSSLYTHSTSYDGRQCGDSRYSILWWIKFGAFAINIIYWPRAHCGSLSTCCTWLLECLVFLCPFSLYIRVCVCVCVCMYVTIYWANLNYVQNFYIILYAIIQLYNEQ
jgi:hypothetical protein